MALVVEDGTGLSTAEAYISIADAETYFNARNSGVTFLASGASAQEEALRNATEYMDSTYRWTADPYGTTQALRWPRYPVYIDGLFREYLDIPVAVTRACAELAEIFLLEGSLYKQVVDSPGAIKSKKIKVGPIATSTEYVSGSSQSAKKYPQVKSILREVTMGNRIERS